MKTKIKFLLLFITLSFVSNIQAQKKGEIVYGYAFAYNYDKKIMYVTNMVEGVENSDFYFDSTDLSLKNQWQDKISTFLDDYYTFQIGQSGFSDEDYIQEDRTKWIGKFKQEGFEIKYVDFYFRKSKKD